MSRVRSPLAVTLHFLFLLFSYLHGCFYELKMLNDFEYKHAHDGFQRTKVLTTKKDKIDFTQRSEPQPCVD